MINLSDVNGNWDVVKQALPEIFQQYEQDIDDVQPRLSLEGKTGAQAQREQCAWPYYYKVRKAELTKLLKYMDARVSSVRGSLAKRYDNGSRALGERTRERYIDNEDEYLRMYELYLEVLELHDKFAAICDAFELRGFAIRDWTQLKINQLEQEQI